VKPDCIEFFGRLKYIQIILGDDMISDKNAREYALERITSLIKSILNDDIENTDNKEQSK
jgi:hypothetical protein